MKSNAWPNWPWVGSYQNSHNATFPRLSCLNNFSFLFDFCDELYYAFLCRLMIVLLKCLILTLQGSEDAFCVGDIGDVITKFNKWKELMPRVEPFYGRH